MPTIFNVIVNPDTASDQRECSSLSVFNARNACNLTAAATKVFSHSGVTGNIASGDTVTGALSGATGVCRMATTTQILISGISGTFQSGEQIRKDLSNYVTSTNAGDSAIAVADCRCTAGTADTTAVTVSGWTTGASNYIKIWTDPALGYRHSGKWITGNKYRLEITTAGPAIDITESYTMVQGLQVKITYSGGSSTGIRNNSWDNGGQIISQNIVRHGGMGVSDTTYGIYFPYSNGTNKIFNNIVYDFNNSSNGGQGISIGYANTAGSKVYNNTVHNCGNGIVNVYSGTNYAYLKNNITKVCATPFSGVWDSNSGRNVSDSGTLSTLCIGHVPDTGYAVGTVAYHLIDTSKAWTSIIRKGMVVKNLTDSTYAVVTNVTDTDLTLDADIFTNGEQFSIYSNIKGSVTFVDEAADDFHLGADTVAADKGYNLFSDVPDDIDGNARPGSADFDIGADEIVSAAAKTPIQAILSSVNSKGSLDNGN
jgi:hypothetical protein